MTPAELKTAHESLGVSTQFLADKMGVHAQRIWDYEHRDRTADVPQHAADVMRELQAAFDGAVDALVERCRQADVEAIPRYPILARFEEMNPELVGWGHLTQGLVVAATQARLQMPIEWAA